MSFTSRDKLGLTESILVLDIIFCCIPDIEYVDYVHIVLVSLKQLSRKHKKCQDENIERHGIVSIYPRSNKEREETKRSHIMLQTRDNVQYYCQ